MVEFQFFEGCPNSDVSLKNLKKLIEEKVIPEEEVIIVKVKDPEEAEKLNFQGSPTILVNGKDIYASQIPKASSYSCRSYVINGVRTGVLSEEYIKKKYLELK